MTSWFRRNGDLRLTALEGEGVVLHLGSRRYFTVNETGVDILNALEEPCTFDTLVREITGKYAVDEQQAARSVRAFLARCTEAALILAEER